MAIIFTISRIRQKYFLISVLTILFISSMILIYPYLENIHYFARNVYGNLNIGIKENYHLENEEGISIIKNKLGLDKKNSREGDIFLSRTLDKTTLFIPKIDLKKEIILNYEKYGEISTDDKINKISNELWHKDNGSKPFENGNTLILGHRFGLSHGVGGLYHIDKLEINDKAYVHSKDFIKEYQVKEILIVSPEKVDIEKFSDEEKLTIYSCHPLSSLDKRYVVVFRPTKVVTVN